MISDIIDILKDKNRPALSNIIYFICCLVYTTILIFYIVPVNIQISLLEELSIDNITNTNKVVISTAIILSLYVIVYIIRRVIISAYKYDDNEKVKKVFSTIYAIDDIFDLFASIISLVFAFTVFVQFYKTGDFYSTKFAWAIHCFIIAKSINFLFHYFKGHNLAEINKVLINYPDFEK